MWCREPFARTSNLPARRACADFAEYVVKMVLQDVILQDAALRTRAGVRALLDADLIFSSSLLGECAYSARRPGKHLHSRFLHHGLRGALCRARLARRILPLQVVNHSVTTWKRNWSLARLSSTRPQQQQQQQQQQQALPHSSRRCRSRCRDSRCCAPLSSLLRRSRWLCRG